MNISNNHQRNSDFFDKIFRIIKNLANDIKRFFTNESIYGIFNSNKRVLLFLIEEKILTIDKNIALLIYKTYSYDSYFKKEIKPFIDKDLGSIPSDYEEKRRIGENDDYACELIRNDNVDDFISYWEKNNKKFDSYSDFNSSYYETNKFPTYNNCRYINYAAYFGSIQILNYLIEKKVALKPEIWLYAVHSKNTEMIFTLEENNIELNGEIFEKCIKEAICCHHNDIASYLQSNYMDLASQYSNSIISAALSSYNFTFIRKESIIESNYYYLFKYNYLYIVI